MKRVLTLGMSLALLITVCVLDTLANQTDVQSAAVCENTEQIIGESSYKEERINNIEETTNNIEETAQPEESLPEETLPEETMPQETKPESSEAETTKPEETLPQETKPESTEAETTKPEESLPQETLPEETKPQSTEAETTKPEETLPQETQPESSEAETTKPEETLPQESKPAETLPQESKPEAAPDKTTHIEGCTDGCTVEGCTCPCHEPSFYDKIMQCSTVEELLDMVNASTEEERKALTTEQMSAVEAKINELLPKQLPYVEEQLEPQDESPVPSEIIKPAVDFINVAPLGDPVIG